MKKLLIILLSALSLTAFSQQKKVAVYVTGDDSGINKVLGSKLVSAIARSEDYSAIERTAAFLAELSKEQNYQRTGAVDDNELSRLGRQFGVNYICAAVVSKAFNEDYISARLIDVETAQVERTASNNGNILSLEEIVDAANVVSSNLFSKLGTERQQNVKKVAVYIIQNEAGKGIGGVLGDKLVAGFTKSGRYVAIERTNSFLSQLSKEQNYQRTGAVDDSDISRLGKQFGVHYVCVADVSDVFGKKFISARLVDVETAEVVNSYEVGGTINTMNSCLTLANEIAANLSKGTFKEQAEEKRLQAEQEKIIRQKAEEEARSKKIAVLDIVDKNNQLSYSYKLLLRSYLKKAISETPGHMAFESSNMDAVMSNEFQKYGTISAKEYQQIYELTGAPYFLYTEASIINNNTINVRVRLMCDGGRKIIFSYEKNMGTSSKDIQAGCKSIINMILDE